MRTHAGESFGKRRGGDLVLGFQPRLIERFAAGCRFPGHGPKLEIATPRSQTGVEGVFGTGAYRL